MGKTNAEGRKQCGEERRRTTHEKGKMIQQIRRKIQVQRGKAEAKTRETKRIKPEEGRK